MLDKFHFIYLIVNSVEDNEIMMAKVGTFLLIAALLPILNAHPLEYDDSSSVPSYEYKQRASHHDLKVNPLLAGQHNENGTSIDTDNNNSTETDATILEETHIEVLLPGTNPLVNSTVLEALLTGTNSSNSTQSDTSTNDRRYNLDRSTYSGSQHNGGLNAQVRPARDTSNESDGNSKENASSEENSSSLTGTITPVLYSSQNANSEPADTKEDSSSIEKNSSEEQAESRPRILSSSYEGSNSRLARDTGDAERHEQSSNKNSPTRVPARSGGSSSSSATPVLYSARNTNVHDTRNTVKHVNSHPSLVTGSSTERVVIVTPQSNLRQPQHPYAQNP